MGLSWTLSEGGLGNGSRSVVDGRAMVSEARPGDGVLAAQRQAIA